MAKSSRISIPISEGQLRTIKQIAKNEDRSEAYIAAALLSDGFKFNQLIDYSLMPSISVVDNFKNIKH